MIFATSRSHRPHHGTLTALLRSTVTELRTLEWDGEGATVELWWGPLVRVMPGDRVSYFPGPTGIVIESVDRASEAA